MGLRIGTSQSDRRMLCFYHSGSCTQQSTERPKRLNGHRAGTSRLAYTTDRTIKHPGGHFKGGCLQGTADPTDENSGPATIPLSVDRYVAAVPRMPLVGYLPRIGFMGFLSLGCTTPSGHTVRWGIQRRRRWRGSRPRSMIFPSPAGFSIQPAAAGVQALTMNSLGSAWTPVLAGLRQLIRRRRKNPKPISLYSLSDWYKISVRSGLFRPKALTDVFGRGALIDPDFMELDGRAAHGRFLSPRIRRTDVRPISRRRAISALLTPPRTGRESQMMAGVES